HYCAEHVAALRQRVGEMREPPLGLDIVPNKSLENFFDEIANAPTTGELLLGIYDRALPAVKAAVERHLAETNPLADHPSIRVLRFALLEISEMLVYGGQAVAKLVAPDERATAGDWLKLLDARLLAAGDLDGTREP